MTLRQLNSSFLIVASVTDHILAPSTEIVIHMTAVVNQTSPMNLSERPVFGTEWVLSVDVLPDELFTVETRYTFYKREKTIINIILVDEVYYVSNVQQPIARRSEIIFRTLLFTTVVIELFRLAFLISKLMFLPFFRFTAARLSKKEKQVDSQVDETNSIEASNTELKTISVDEGKILYLIHLNIVNLRMKKSSFRLIFYEYLQRNFH